MSHGPLQWRVSWSGDEGRVYQFFGEDENAARRLFYEVLDREYGNVRLEANSDDVPGVALMSRPTGYCWSIVED